MQTTKQLSSAGQSIWLDKITRDLLLTGTPQQYIRDLSVTGLTSNSTIFDEPKDLHARAASKELS